MTIHSKGNKAQNRCRPGCRAKAPDIFRAAMMPFFLLFLLAPAFAQISPSPDAGSAPPGASSITRPEIGFATPQRLKDHYEKHGKEFGTISRGEYLRKAQELRDRPAGGEILEAVRRDGVVTRFDRKTGAFLAFNPDGTIRTFFKPNDGERYFRRQAKRK
jgi:hypothetical protein